MRVWTLISPFLLSLVLGVPIVLVPTYASGACCGCGKCWMKYYTNPPCYCPGENGCATCFSDDSDLVQFHAVTDHRSADISSIPEGLVSTIAESDVTDQVMDLLKGGKCFRGNVAFSLLGSARDSLKFVPVRFDEKNAQDQTLAF